jgi:DHA1 family multidrug resistance protein-like MFS transporter
VGRALTTISASFNGGAILGPVAGGLLAEAFGLRMVYGFAASLFIISTALILFLQDQPVEPHDDGHRYRALLHNAALGRLLLVVFVGVTAMYLSWPLTPVYLQSQRGLTVSQIGALGSVNALGIVLLNLTLGRAKPRLGIIASQGIVAVSVLFLWRGMGLPWLGLGYLLAGGFRTARSLMSALIEQIVLPSQMGLAFGLMETLSGVGLAVAPVLAGLLYARQPAAPYPVSLLLLAGSVVLFFLLVPSGDAGLPARPAAQNTGGQRRE